MSEAIQTIKAANVGIEGITNLIAQAKSLASSALSASVSDAQAFGSQFNEVFNQIETMAADSGYKGVNLLQGGAMTVQFDARAGDSTLYVEGFGGSVATDFTILTANLSTTDLAGAAWIGGGAICTTNIENVITGLENAEAELRVRAKNLSSDLSIITAREDFTSKMINTLEDGAATLTEADMNEEGANMLMLQTRQALGTTSLSLASQAAQSVLRLF
jgi:flagellin-like hook-associated protein FlgL